MFNSDFAWLNFDENLGALNGEATRAFQIDEELATASQHGSQTTSQGYILIQARDVGESGDDPGDTSGNMILINGVHLPAFDMVVAQGWNLWMDRIPAGILKKGANRLTIRARNDRFRVANVVVHWRERRGTRSLGVGNLTAEVAPS